MIYTVSFAVFLFVLATVQAVRDEHLVVMRWPVGYFFMERGEDGRYVLFAPLRLPLVVARYARLSVAAGVHSLFGRLRTRPSQTRVAYR